MVRKIPLRSEDWDDVKSSWC